MHRRVEGRGQGLRVSGPFTVELLRSRSQSKAQAAGPSPRPFLETLGTRGGGPVLRRVVASLEGIMWHIRRTRHAARAIISPLRSQLHSFLAIHWSPEMPLPASCSPPSLGCFSRSSKQIPKSSSCLEGLRFHQRESKFTRQPGKL